MNTTPPQYVLPPEPKHVGEMNWKALRAALLFFCVWNWVITEVLASYFTWQRALGTTHTAIGKWMVYPPWQWMVWFSSQAFTNKSLGVIFPLTGGLFAALIGFTLSIGLMRNLVNRSLRRAMENQKDLHGSAKFATAEDITERAGLLSGKNGLVIGGWMRDENTLVPLISCDDGHSLLIAPPGMGKTAGPAASTLLTNTSWSFIVLDLKGELHKLTSGYRKAIGHKVFCFAPSQPNTSRYNLFEEMIRLGTWYDVQDVEQIVTEFCHEPDDSPTDKHWDDIAKDLDIGIVLHEAYKAKLDGRVVTGRDIAGAFDVPDFITYLNEMTTFEHDPGLQYGWILKGKPQKTHPRVRSAALAMLGRAETNEYNSCLSNARKRFTIYLNPLVINATRQCDFTIDDLVNADTPATLYIVVPIGDIKRLRQLLRVTLTLLFARLSETQRIETPNKYQLTLILDEIARLEQMDVLKTTIPLIRGFRVKVLMICQSVKQLYDVYGPYQSLIDSCTSLISYTPSDNDTARLLSELTGVRTVEYQAASFSGGRYDVAMKGLTTHTQHDQRPLMTPDEVRRLRTPIKDGDVVTAPGDMLIFVSGIPPVLGRQWLYFLDPLLKQRSTIQALSVWDVIRQPALANAS
jgi:type IV secretion system protein VirD4